MCIGEARVAAIADEGVEILARQRLVQRQRAAQVRRRIARRVVALIRLLIDPPHVQAGPLVRREPVGPGTGYGLLKALDGCIDHLGFAADVRDASPNLKAGVPTLVATLQPLGREVRTIAALAADARRSPDAALALAYAQDVRQRCDRLLVTLVQARQRLDALLAAEQPPYRPVARHYLFGIIRLPSGDWAWASAGQRADGYAPHH